MTTAENKKAAAALKELGVRRMASKFGSACKACGGWMPAGTLINWSKTGGAAHADGCPATPATKPAPKVVDVKALVATLTADLATHCENRRSAHDAWMVADKALAPKLAAAGYCASCQGAGWVHLGYDSDYDCNCPKPSDIGSTLERHPELKPEHEQVAALRREWQMHSETAALTERKIAELNAVRKFDRVEVVKGRKVPVGTVGVAIWIGDSPFGARVGVKDDAGTVHWTALSNVSPVSREE